MQQLYDHRETRGSPAQAGCAAPPHRVSLAHGHASKDATPRLYSALPQAPGQLPEGGGRGGGTSTGRRAGCGGRRSRRDPVRACERSAGGPRRTGPRVCRDVPAWLSRRTEERVARALSVLIALLDEADAGRVAAREAVARSQVDHDLLIPVTAFSEPIVAPYRRSRRDGQRAE